MQKSIFKILLVLLIVPVIAVGAVNNSAVKSQFHGLRHKISVAIQNGNFTQAQSLLNQAQTFLNANHNPITPLRLSDRDYNTMLSNLMRYEAVQLYTRTRQWDKAANAIKVASRYNYRPSDAAQIRTYQSRANSTSVAYTANVVNTAIRPTRYVTPVNRTKLISDINAKRALISRLIRQRRFADALNVYRTASRMAIENKALLGNAYNSIRHNLYRTGSDLEAAQGNWRAAEVALINAQRFVNSRIVASRLNYIRQRIAQTGQSVVNVPSMAGQVTPSASLVSAATSQTGALNAMAGATSYFQLRLAYERLGYPLALQERSLLQQKLNIAREMSGSLSSSQLADMQAKLKEIDDKLASINEQKANAQRVYLARKNKLNLSARSLTSTQSNILMGLGLKITRLNTANASLKRMITEQLSNVAVTSEVTWDGLKENFEVAKKTQLEILELKSRLSALVNKSPMSEADKKEAEMLKTLLEKAIEISDSALEKVQSEFANAETFGKLSASEKIEYIGLFKDVWLKQREVNESSPTAEELFKWVNGPAEDSGSSEETASSGGTASENPVASESSDTTTTNPGTNVTIYINSGNGTTSIEKTSAPLDAGVTVTSSGDNEDL